jgi:hypothetical protein
MLTVLGILGALGTGVLGAGAQAKDLTHRLGVGYANQFGLNEDLPSLALRYYPNQEYGLMAALGVDTTKDNARFGFQAKIMKTVFREDNLNFYTGAGAGIISRQENAKTDSGFDLSGFVGTEFFFGGLENLGFNMEAGVGVTSVSSEVRFRTIGDHPLRAGIFFYF